MSAGDNGEPSRVHAHGFLGIGHAPNERKTWAVIALCTAMMALAIGGGALFGSLALVADGLHMSTHAIALLSGRFLGWVWMDPVMGIVGAGVIAAWAYALVRDTGRRLLDMTPDAAMAGQIKRLIEQHGDRVTDLRVWQLGPGHLGAIVAVVTGQSRGPDFYRAKLASFRTLSHVTIEVIKKP